ncbi:uncharacterized protein BDR25DRAFT_354823 [Lindgomyces ingoldianus]|uniref:Uncharacterized protein n=1 Tax=Lindgomyces ingoldianus TaxID=673940 RepID=A0ACB6QVI2_9PLEO|nr:uncharacterized protein BDR25DRAFT_354823 [Lindgomyces ingoldianus]KAF2470876.1 hypothetical protein BDR25DRAFT_354823 [Lindgomyces ingoldianus]
MPSQVAIPTEPNVEPPLPPREHSNFALRLRHGLNLNPGFCPGAVKKRRFIPSSMSISLGDDLREDYSRCTHCGLDIHTSYPKSYTQDWIGFAPYSQRFAYVSHVSVNCLICWEHKGVWVEPMDINEWALHTRKHFKDDGYQMRGINVQRRSAPRYIVDERPALLFAPASRRPIGDARFMLMRKLDVSLLCFRAVGGEDASFLYSTSERPTPCTAILPLSTSCLAIQAFPTLPNSPSRDALSKLPPTILNPQPKGTFRPETPQPFRSPNRDLDTYPHAVALIQFSLSYHIPPKAGVFSMYLFVLDGFMANRSILGTIFEMFPLYVSIIGQQDGCVLNKIVSSLQNWLCIRDSSEATIRPEWRAAWKIRNTDLVLSLLLRCRC